MNNKFAQANILKIAAVAIAAPRWVGAFAAAIGVDALSEYDLLSDAEALSGGAMALLEGFAIAYVMSKWKLLKPGCFQWYTLLAFSLLLAATLPLVATPYLLIEQDDSSIGALFEHARGLQIAWSVLVAAVPMLVIMAVGFADSSNEQMSNAQVAPEQDSALLLLAVEQGIALPANGQLVPAQSNGSVKLLLADEQLTFCCQRCERAFSSKRALAGHLRHCKE